MHTAAMDSDLIFNNNIPLLYYFCCCLSCFGNFEVFWHVKCLRGNECLDVIFVKVYINRYGLLNG